MQASTSPDDARPARTRAEPYALAGAPAHRPTDSEPREGRSGCHPRLPFGVAALVLGAGIVIHGAWYIGSRLGYGPDASHYITLAIALLERGDVHHELYAYRTPGYPLLLAAVFELTGPAASNTLLALQHAMVVGTALLAAVIAWTIRPSRPLAVTAGLLTCVDMQLAGFANAVLTEVPYALLLTLSVLGTVRFHRFGGRRWLLIASLAAGAAAWVKPVGQLVLAALVLSAVHRSWSVSRPAGGWRGAARTLAGDLCVAALPCAVLLVPVMWQNHVDRGRFQFSCIGGLSWYTRAVIVDKLDIGTKSPLMAEIRRDYERAGADGVIDATVPMNNAFWQTLDAIRHVRGCNVSEAAELMGRAGVEMLREDPKATVRKGLYYAYLMLMKPGDGFGLMPPPDGEVGAYYGMVANRIGPQTLERYLPLQTLDSQATNEAARVTRRATEAVVRFKADRIDRGRPVLGLLDTPHEEYALVFLLGCLMAVAGSSRWSAGLLLFVIAYHIGLSAFLHGPLPRYMTPVAPLMGVVEAMVIVAAGGAAATLVRAFRGKRAGAGPFHPPRLAR